MKTGLCKVVVLGAYGNFGKRICESLAGNPDIHLIISGRNIEKAISFSRYLKHKYPGVDPETVILDVNAGEFKNTLKSIQPEIVIHTAGPFQGQDYKVPEACIDTGAHYIDLADDRRFVCDIKNLNQAALNNQVLIVSGASSVPGLSSAVIDHYSAEFNQLDEIDFGIVPGNQAERGAATLRGILSYVGHPFKSWIDNTWKDSYGWSDIRRLQLDNIPGNRWLANVDIPDLELFPQRYPGVTTVRFQAGLELGLLHNTMAVMSLLTKHGLVKNWARYTQAILRISHLFDYFGSDTGAMFVSLKGTDQHGENLALHWTLIAPNGMGPYIPTIAAVIITNKLLQHTITIRGAMPCLGLFSLEEFFKVANKWSVYHELERAR